MTHALTNCYNSYGALTYFIFINSDLFINNFFYFLIYIHIFSFPFITPWVRDFN
jgi:hypothetical protein